MLLQKEDAWVFTAKVSANELKLIRSALREVNFLSFEDEMLRQSMLMSVKDALKQEPVPPATVS
jgi:hypothetical protein